MRGAGSHDFAVTDMLVSHEQTPPRSHTIQPHHPGVLYIFGASETPLGADWTIANAPWVGVAGVAMVAVCLGIARGAIDAFIDFTATQAQQGGRRLLRDNLLIQDQMGRAEAALRAARSDAYQTIGEQSLLSRRKGTQPLLIARSCPRYLPVGLVGVGRRIIDGIRNVALWCPVVHRAP
jgi:alkylation response protein AidB-like acyl-CoA dehydrogenase